MKFTEEEKSKLVLFANPRTKIGHEIYIAIEPNYGKWYVDYGQASINHQIYDTFDEAYEHMIRMCNGFKIKMDVSKRALKKLNGDIGLESKPKNLRKTMFIKSHCNLNYFSPKFDCYVFDNDKETMMVNKSIMISLLSWLKKIDHDYDFFVYDSDKKDTIFLIHWYNEEKNCLPLRCVRINTGDGLEKLYTVPEHLFCYGCDDQ